MNLNEECLLHYLKNPQSLNTTMKQIRDYIFVKESYDIKQQFKKYFMDER